MLQAVFTGVGRLQVRDVPMPEPAADEVLIRVEASGVCGTDRSFFSGHRKVEPPVVLGHEYAGTVVECGSSVTTLRPGDRIAVDPNLTCGRCTYCRRGMVNLCDRMVSLGVTTDGGYAEFSRVPERNAYAIPDGLAMETAALTEPLACAIRGITRARIALGDVVVVLGAGPMGLLLLQLARLQGAAVVIASSGDAGRRDLAAQLGADVVLDRLEPEQGRETIWSLSDGLGADVVIEASGHTDTAQRALSLIRPGGTCLLFGCCPQSDHIRVQPLWAQEREITIRGSYINPFTHSTAVKLLSAGRIRVDSLISERISLGQLGSVLSSEAPKTPGRVIVRPQGSKGS